MLCGSADALVGIVGMFQVPSGWRHTVVTAHHTFGQSVAAPLQPPCLTQNAQVYQSELEVIEGALPADLSGAFLRNGPNPKLPVEGGYHW